MPIGEIPPSFCWYDPFLYLPSHPQWVHTSYHHHKPNPRWDIFLLKKHCKSFSHSKPWMMRGRGKNLQNSATNFSFFTIYDLAFKSGFFVLFFWVLFAPYSKTTTPRNNRPTANSNLRLGPRLAWLGCRFGACLGSYFQWGTGVIYDQLGTQVGPTT